MGVVNQTTAYINQQFNTFMITEDGGMAIKMINKTGSASVKGTVLMASTSVANAVNLQANQYDSAGIMYSNGVADGGEVWVVTSGKAYVLLADTTASTMGNWVFSSLTDGRANATLTAPPGGTISAIDEHFKEVGHCLQTVTAGTSKLALCFVHFN